MEIELNQVAEVYIFLPKPKDNVYLQWFEKDPSKGAKGPIFSFIIAQGDDEVLDSATYIKFDNYLEKFGYGENYNDFVPTLRKAISKKLKIDENLAKSTLLMIQGLFEDEAEDIDNAPFNYILIETHINEYIGFNHEMGLPDNRLQLRIRTNAYNHEDAKIKLKDRSISFDDSKLQTFVAVSTTEAL